MGTNKKELVTIITIVYNDVKNIEGTILSVLSQSYSNIEYLIIDGKSTDGTFEILSKYNEEITIISEKDNGIYDAMNKGIRLANGNWILFMNSNDQFVDETVIEDLIKYSNSYSDIIYGNMVHKDDPNKLINKPRELKKFWRGLPFCHQATLVRKRIHLEYPFELKYRISSVHDFFFKLYKLKKYKFQYIDRTVCEYDIGGISATSYLWLWDNLRINLKYSKRNLHKVIYRLFRHFFIRTKKKLIG